MEILWVFDGRDIADQAFLNELTQREPPGVCPHCGTRRNPQLPFCCELASISRAAAAVQGA
jgi:hypothetical protein